MVFVLKYHVVVTSIVIILQYLWQNNKRSCTNVWENNNIGIVRDSGDSRSTCLDCIYLQLSIIGTRSKINKNNSFIVDIIIFVVSVSTDRLFSCLILRYCATTKRELGRRRRETNNTFFRSAPVGRAGFFLLSTWQSDEFPISSDLANVPHKAFIILFIWNLYLWCW